VSLPSLEHPEWVVAVAAVVSLTAIGVFAAHLVAGRRIRRFDASRAGADRSGVLRDASLVAALCAIGIAAVGPHLGERVISVPSGGVDVVFVVDVSRSMEAADVPPTRLDRARRATEELIGRLQEGDRAALVAFADRGMVLAPLTPDRVALIDLLAGIEAGLLEPAASNLANGIETALALFDRESDRPRAIVLTSDGEDSSPRGDRGAAAAARADVRVVTLALGTEAGAHLADSGGVLHDRRGDPVVTRRNAGELERLALATGGQPFVADEWGRFDFDRGARALRGDVGRNDETVERRVAAPRVTPFAALAFAILWAEVLPLPAARKRRHATQVLAAASMAWWGSGLVAPPAAVGESHPAPPGPEAVLALQRSVRDAPSDARAHIDLGIAYLALGNDADATHEFLAATVHAREPEVVATAYFDLGVAALHQEEWNRARDAFFEVLALDPDDDAARFNLEWTLAALRRLSAEPRPDAFAAPAPPARPSPSEAALEADAAAPQGPEPPGSAGGAQDLRPPMSPEERRAWLDRAAEDPRRWLRTTSANPEPERPRDRDPVW